MNKLLSLLGIARRAGKLSLGAAPVQDAIRRREAKLLLAAGDVSPRSWERAQTLARAENVLCLQTAAPMDELAAALGKRVGVLAVRDDGFAKAITRLWNEDTSRKQNAERVD